MYETDYTGWTRTPEELEKLKNNKWYRFKMNCKWFKISVLKPRWGIDKYYLPDIWYNFKNLIFNRNNY